MFDTAERLMNDINVIANQLHTNTSQQHEELVRTDVTMVAVVKNTEDAHEQIVEAQDYQKSTGKWMCWILAVIITLSLILILVFTLR